MSEPSVEDLSPDELERLPVFPLPRVVFFPGSMLPLHVFEPRYRAMMEDCVSSGPRAMAVALLKPGWDSDYEGRPPVHEIAGAGRIVEWQRRADGRFDLVLQGMTRVRLEELPAEGLAYRRARATPLPDRMPHRAPVEHLVLAVSSAASSVVSLVRQRHPDFELGIGPETPPGLLADRVADRLVADMAARQELLEQTDVKVRLARLADLLLALLAELGPREGGLH